MPNEQTSMNDLLSRRVVDEREKSPDDASDGPIVDREEPEAFEGREPFDQQSEPAAQAQSDATQPKPQPDAQQPAAKAAGEPEADGTNLQGLPKAFHARVQAADERKRVAEERAAAAERRAAELDRRLSALEKGQGGEEQEQPTWDQWTKEQLGTLEQKFEQQDWVRRNQFGWRLAVREHGQELPHEATTWANDRVAADPIFAQQIRQADDPVDFAINEFRKAQFASEAAKHGWDIDKMIAARAGAKPASAPAQQPQPAAAQTAAPQQQNEPRMPSDFAGASAGAGRVNGDAAGLTPLGDLLNLSTPRQRRG